MKKLAIFLTTCFSFMIFSLAAESTEEEPYTHKLMSIAYEYSGGDTYTAYIRLSTGTNETEWKVKCDIYEELVIPRTNKEPWVDLGTWEEGDVIHITANNERGINLKNPKRSSHVYAYITKKSLDLLPTIKTVGDTQWNWGFKYCILVILDQEDESKWKRSSAKPEHWSEDNKIIISKNSGGKHKMINLTLSWLKGKSERCITVTKED